MATAGSRHKKVPVHEPDQVVEEVEAERFGKDELPCNPLSFSLRPHRRQVEEELKQVTRSSQKWQILAVSGWMFALAGWLLFLAHQYRWLDAISMESRQLFRDDFFGHTLGSISSRSLAGTTDDHASSDTSTDASAHDEHAEHSEHGHPHEALMFLLMSMIVGAIITALTSLKMFSVVPQTVALFLAGILCSVIMNTIPDSGKMIVWNSSYKMWMSIDPHLLLFTMLPSLLMADAMTIDTSVAMRVARQCVYLAGPGVLINAALVALFLFYYLPYDWPFLLCLTTGSILCATDPVAVVALLKELGASPILTVQIQGEALLNDGTAIVLYLVAYSMLTGAEYDFQMGVIILIKMVVLACACGAIVGGLFLLWIKYSSNKLDHNSAVIQTVLTLGAAYWSFFVSEGIFGISGVLSCVACALVLAHKMWPSIVDRESLMSFWHCFEYLCNTLIFFLAGALTGDAMATIEAEDWGHLLVIYVVLICVRFAFTMMSRPILKALSPEKMEVSIADAMVVTWGGLRGAVGLALAIQVNNDQAKGQISAKDGQRVLFYVGGIALLTLVINATTCPFLVNALGITRWPKAKKQMLLLLYKHLKFKAQQMPSNRSVQTAISTVLADVKHHIQISPEGFSQDQDELEADGNSSGIKKGGMRASAMTMVADGLKYMGNAVNTTMKDGEDLLEEFEEEFSKCEALASSDREEQDPSKEDIPSALDLLVQVPCQQQHAVIKALVKQDRMDGNMVRAFNEVFLTLVSHQYWHMIEEQVLPDQSIGEQLLLSVTMAQHNPPYDLKDYGCLQKLNDGLQKTRSEQSRAVGKSLSETGAAAPPGPLQSFAESIGFNVVMTSLILASVAVSQYEDTIVSKTPDEEVTFLAIEIFFLSAFFIECLLKILLERIKFFKNAMNLFDFVLVWLGLAGIILTMVATDANSGGASDTQAVSTQSRLIRTARVFRVLRLVRLVRLYRFYLTLKAKFNQQELSLELSRHLYQLALLDAFVKAHVAAQREMVKFFCQSGQVPTAVPEISRVILSSQIHVYKAIAVATSEERGIGIRALRGVNTLRESLHVVRMLEHFVTGAHKSGILNASETESLLHPLHDHMSTFTKRISKAYDGVQTSELDAPTAANPHNHHTEKKNTFRSRLFNAVAKLGSSTHHGEEENHGNAPHPSADGGSICPLCDAVNVAGTMKCYECGHDLEVPELDIYGAEGGPSPFPPENGKVTDPDSAPVLSVLPGMPSQSVNLE